MPTRVSNWSMHGPSSRHRGRKTECLWYSFLGHRVYSRCFRRTPIQPELTPQCPKAETPMGPKETHRLSAWNEPHSVPRPKPEQVLRRPDSLSSWTESHNVPKLKPQRVLRRPDSRQQPQAARCSGRAGIPPGVGVGQGGGLLAPGQPRELQIKPPSLAQAQLSGDSAPQGSSARSIKLCKFKLKYCQYPKLLQNS